MQKFLEEENNILKGMVEKIEKSGANVVVAQKGVDDVAQHYLARAGIMAIRRVKESDMTKLSKATGARIVTNLDDLTSKDLGQAKLAEERKIEEDKWVYIEGCKNPKAVTILVRGGSQRVVDEAERALHDALMVTKDVVEIPQIVAGGGAPEVEIASRVREWAQKLSRQGTAGRSEIRRRSGDDRDGASRERRDGPNRHTGRAESPSRQGRKVGRRRRTLPERWRTCGQSRSWSPWRSRRRS